MRLTSWFVAVIVVAWTHGAAAAYPEFQFSTGTTRCSECHFSPVGGGLINDYGRDEAATTISGTGDGRFMHGALELPSWFALGADVRIAGLGKRIRDGSEAAVFPMQADGYARVVRGNWSASITAGILAAIRKPQPFADRLGTREHYVQYQTTSREWYARAGRFFPTFGLRLPDHTAYVRRYTGLHTLEESYGIGAGVAKDTWEAHATVLTPLELRPQVGRHGWGIALQVEKLTDEVGSWSLQGKTLRHDDGRESWVGGTWKRWVASKDLLVAAELNAGVSELVASSVLVSQLVGYAAVHYRAGKPWGVALATHYHDADLRLRSNERSALEARFAWFPRAHFELSALVRGAAVAFELERGDVLGFLQLHYYL